jgi:myosin-crossreactive antigen
MNASQQQKDSDMNTNIILAYGLNDEETAEAVRTTLNECGGDVRLAALRYIDANPDAELDEIEAAIRETLKA